MRAKSALTKKIVLLVVATVLAVGLVGCGGTKDTKTEEKKASNDAGKDGGSSSDLKPFRVGCGDASKNTLNDLAAVAQKNGYLEEELNKVGYTLQVTGFQGQGPEINAALMSGSLDAGNYAELPALTSKASGADTTVIALSDRQLQYGILTGSDNIKTVKDLEGKKIVVQQGTVIQYVWEQIVKATGINADKIEIINSNPVDGISLIQTGDADALVSSANSLENYARQGVGHIVEEVPDTAYSLTLFNISNAFLKKAPEVAVAVNKALIRTYDDVVADPQILYDTLGERYGDGGAEIIKSTYTVNDSLEYLYPEFDDSFNSYIHTFYDWMEANSLLASEVDVDTYFDSSYFQKALEELGK